MVVSTLYASVLLKCIAIMKTKTKSTEKRKYGKAHPHLAPSKRRTEDRDLNEDDQNIATNVSVDESIDDDRYQKLPLDDVEQEEERERKRKVEDARGEEEN
jgi:hypothetical protein